MVISSVFTAGDRVLSVRVSVRWIGKLGVHLGIDHRHRDRGHPDRLAFARTGEDHVFHPAAAQALGALLAENPTDGVAEVRFAAAVRTDNGRDAGAVKRISSGRKRLKPLDFNALELEQWVLPFPVNTISLRWRPATPASRGMQPILN